jgi:hypothetical protein
VAVAPWVDHPDEEALKEKILALSSDQRNFTRDPPAGQKAVDFDFDASFPVAMAILDDDKKLEEMRFELVPKTCTCQHRTTSRLLPSRLVSSRRPCSPHPPLSSHSFVRALLSLIAC